MFRVRVRYNGTYPNPFGGSNKVEPPNRTLSNYWAILRNPSADVLFGSSQGSGLRVFRPWTLLLCLPLRLPVFFTFRKLSRAETHPSETAPTYFELCRGTRKSWHIRVGMLPLILTVLI